MTLRRGPTQPHFQQTIGLVEQEHRHDCHVDSVALGLKNRRFSICVMLDLLNAFVASTDGVCIQAIIAYELKI